MGDAGRRAVSRVLSVRHPDAGAVSILAQPLAAAASWFGSGGARDRLLSPAQLRLASGPARDAAVCLLRDRIIDGDTLALPTRCDPQLAEQPSQTSGGRYHRARGGGIVVLPAAVRADAANGGTGSHS